MDRLEIGIDPEAGIAPIVPFEGKSIAYYGTSIVHGEGASRPGMCHASILGRRLDRSMINLGFAGSGLMDIEIAHLMAELDPALYIVDCLPNMPPEMIAQRTEPFVRVLRVARPTTPILLVEDRTGTNAWFWPKGMDLHMARRRELRTAYQRLTDAGGVNLHYAKGDDLLGDDSEATVDSSHPSDLGYVRLADALQPIIGSLIS